MVRVDSTRYERSERVAIVALVLWTITAAAGVYLLISSTRIRPEEAAQAERVGATATAGSPARPERPGDRFDPPSLQAAKSEPMPGMRAFAEFLHPALAVTGFAFWLAYTFIRNPVLAAIGLGVVLGAIAAGLAYAGANARAAKREGSDTLSFKSRVVLLHVVGATLTLLVVILIVAHV
jgi:hypothetical protein